MSAYDGLLRFNALFGADATQGQALKLTAQTSGIPGVNLATDPTVPIVGFAEFNTSSGTVGSVVCGGMYSMAIAGGALTPGTNNFVTVNGSSKLVAAAAGDAVYVIGQFIQALGSTAVAAANDKILIHIAPSYVK